MSKPKHEKHLLSRAWEKLWTRVWWVDTVAPIALRTSAYGVFTGAAALIPLFLLADSKDPPAELFEFSFLAGGDLLIISLVLIIGALGDLIYSLFSAESKNWRLLLTAMVIGQVLGGAGCVIAYVMGGHEAKDLNNKETTVAALHSAGYAQLSLWLFAAALVLGWGTLMLKTAAGGD